MLIRFLKFMHKNQLYLQRHKEVFSCLKYLQSVFLKLYLTSQDWVIHQLQAFLWC